MSTDHLTIFSLEELVAHSRANAPFYRSLYADLSKDPALTDLPVIEQEQFWNAHGADRRAVLTGPLENGGVFNSGGTTGTPKYSYFSHEEWDSIVTLSARCYESAGLRDGDRVANLFASGNLYASFLFATESMRRARPRVVQFPLGFSPNLAPAAAIIHEFKLNVLAGFPTHLLRIIEHLEQEKLTGVHLDRIIYAGELFSQDQKSFLQARFPGIQTCSAGYASVDAGLIGYADATCAPGEHRMFDGATLLEIVDEETEQPVEAPGFPGRVVFTNLTRKLMPLLRYPTGDRAQWVEPAGAADRKFQLLGRSQEAARVAGYSIGVTEVAGWLEPLREATGWRQFQLLVTRPDRFDQLTIRLVGDAAAETLAAGSKALLETFAQARPEIYEEARAGILHHPRVEWIAQNQLIVSERTGKLLRVVDRRNG